MRNMTLPLIAEAVGGQLVRPGAGTASDSEATAVVIDSRKCESGCIFVAIAGEKVDGHTFIGQVFEKGALGVICEKLPDPVPGPCILVDSSYKALRELAAYYRSQLDIGIVGIVGSVGKTSTKELVASVLAQHYRVHKTEGNFNNEVGVPLTIFGIREEHEMAVIEMGINKFGEMDRLGTIVRPDAVVMTNIGPCHLEFLGDLDGVLRAKSEVFTHIAHGGLLALNSEDTRLNTVTDAGDVRIVRYGRGGSVYASDIVSRGFAGSDCLIHYNNDGAGCFNAHVPLPGPHMVMNALAATAIGLEFGLTADEIAAGIAAVRPVAGRCYPIEAGRLFIVDDSYNANPKSTEAAIDTLAETEGRRIAILGDMFELGAESALLHEEVGRYAAEHGVDVLICVGGMSGHMYEGALNAGTGTRVVYYADLKEALEKLPTFPFEAGDTVFVKASHGMEFAKIVELLKNIG